MTSPNIPDQAPQIPQTPAAPAAGRQPQRSLWLDLLFVLILFFGAWLRLTGLHWDQGTQLHPDERFMMMVAAGISPVPLDQYFNTAQSTLNPSNTGHGFYVYGTLPLFIVRYAGEFLGKTDYFSIAEVGRIASTVVDLLTAILAWMLAWRLTRRQWAAVLAGSFYALSVLPIQLSHFFKEDPFVGFFTVLAFLFAAYILPLNGEEKRSASGVWGAYLGFGIAAGMALASKIMIAPLVVVLPAVAAVRWYALEPRERERAWQGFLVKLAVAGVLAFLVFRVCQPYAFEGPGFLGMLPNEQWVNTMRAIAAQNAGDVDFPPQLQWARRPFWFSWQNQVFYGFGLALGLTAWAGYLWMGWRLLQDNPDFRRRFLVLWLWTGLYFTWQSLAAARTMRYMIPTYPLLVVVAGWGLSEWRVRWRAGSWLRRGLPVMVATLVLVASGLWAAAFTSIYRSPFTRAEASRWIYQNIPGPLTLSLETESGVRKQPLSFKHGATLYPDDPVRLVFTPEVGGDLSWITFEHVVLGGAFEVRAGQPNLTIALEPVGGGFRRVSSIQNDFPPEQDSRGNSFSVPFEPPVRLEAGRKYVVEVGVGSWQGTLNLSGTVFAGVENGNQTEQFPLPRPENTVREGMPLEVSFRATETGRLTEVTLSRVLDWEQAPGNKRLTLTVGLPGQPELASAVIEAEFLPTEANRLGEAYTLRLAQPVEMVKGQEYTVRLLLEGEGRLAVYGYVPIRETSWDDALPHGLDGHSPYSLEFGPYRSDLNLEAYDDDNPEKLTRMLNALEEGDYYFISSNRQWGTTTRVPERYPLFTAFYRELAGCPPQQTVFDCYALLEPGMYQGRLGFELVKTITSYPRLAGIDINDQFAEEAFSVYDHPKVLIFRKTAAYDREQVKAILSRVDLTKVIRLSPKNAGKIPGTLELNDTQRWLQQSGGTWRELFLRESPLNRYPVAGVVAWYLVIAGLGWVTYPILRLALRGLPDRGYPFARIGGLLLLAWPVWMLASNGAAFSRTTISLVALGLAVVGLLFAWLQRSALLAEWKERWKYFLTIEGIALLFFVAFLLVRLGNGDLWHPWKGGEKPMDFAYFNAVLKSTVFPPYDPWFAGGYLNYYYYGFVLVGVPVKWLGLVPSFAYNLILPLLFSTLALGGFSIAWNLRVALHGNGEGEGKPWGTGVLAALFLTVMGNLGNVRMVLHGFQQIGAPDGQIAGENLFQRLGWLAAGIGKAFTGQGLPYGWGDWYWIPSRVYPYEVGNPITEFPAFTFLYADLHAHLIALSVTLLGLAAALAIVLAGWRWSKSAGVPGWLAYFTTIGLASLALGALRPINTWDFPVYFLLALIAVLYAGSRQPLESAHVHGVHPRTWRIVSTGFSALLLTALSFLLYEPFTRWFGQAYTSAKLWEGLRSPSASYLVHWGIFLFILTGYLLVETIHWMRATPLSRLARYREWRSWIPVLLFSLTVVIIGLVVILKVWTAWIILPLMAWCLVLILRPGLPSGRRALLFLVGTALALTLTVELVVLVGDIERMNTVFKFYLQAWVLLAVTAAPAFTWFLDRSRAEFSSGLRSFWVNLTLVLVACGLLFAIMGGTGKIKDRMSAQAPHTLDGMTYMVTATYAENDRMLDLGEDYRAIRWMQDNVDGSPVIVEGSVGEYRWGSRFAINTGLPAVVGWNWHQRQQRGVVADGWVFTRVEDVNRFYSTLVVQEAQEFIERYRVRYIIIGQLERAIYSAEGLEKFAAQDGVLWDAVYRDGETLIYRVK